MVPIRSKLCFIPRLINRQQKGAMSSRIIVHVWSRSSNIELTSKSLRASAMAVARDHRYYQAKLNHSGVEYGF